jgi:hypothetical protein
MLPNVKFRDIFATLNGGILPQTLATGTTSGSAIQLGGPGPLGKIAFRALASMLASATSNSGVMSLYLATATASGGTFTSISQTLVSASISVSGSMFQLITDTRNEAFCNLATGSLAPTWVKPVIALGTAAMPVFLDVLGWSAGDDPADNYDSATINTTETLFY